MRSVSYCVFCTSRVYVLSLNVSFNAVISDRAIEGDKSDLLFEAIQRLTRNFCPALEGRIYRHETQGRYHGEPVPMTGGKGSTSRSKTITISWLTSVGIAH